MANQAMNNGIIFVVICLVPFITDAERSQCTQFANNAAIVDVSSIASSQQGQRIESLFLSRAPKLEDVYEKGNALKNADNAFMATKKGTESKFVIKEVKRSEYRKQEKEAMSLKLPFVAEIVDTFKPSFSNVALVTRFYEGGDIQQYLSTHVTVGIDKLKSWGSQMAYGLWSLHRNNILYRDLSLENTFFFNASLQSVVLGDFGLAKTGCGPTACSRTGYGTTRFVSPAIAGFRKYGYEADWWSHAVALFVMARGQYPFEGFSDESILSRIKNADGKKILEPLKAHDTYAELCNYLSNILDKDAYTRLETDSERNLMVGKASTHPLLKDKFWHGHNCESLDGQEESECFAAIDAHWSDLCKTLAINKDKCV
eukprot:TRINITY_DN8069_c0_g1_i1.p1 TRINITY_DN8069_c0_g1~~TRINITY_DN8069_c0_g1_i1.p1  ORF type:complete len:401 (+),score=42.07 TRINITY_DN8069_c0_g1_i1:93-1205(+)